MGSFSKISSTIKLEWSYVLLVIVFGLYACPSTNKKDAVLENKDSIPTAQIKEINYSLQIDELDSKTFIANYNATLTPSPPQADTNFASVSKRLKNWVVFDSMQVVLKINFSNGKTYKLQEGDYFAFIAYYPSEDILLCEGGHTSDVSFNLSTGEETDLTGNPQYIVSDPKNEIRLNAYFGGQECYTYFIQKKIHGVFTKVIDLQAKFPELCIIENAFWINDKNLLIKAMVGGDENGNPSIQYYRLSILEQ